MEKYKIGEENVNCRIDKIIPILNENITRVATQKLLEEGKILVNDKKTLPKHPENSRKLTKRSSLVSISMPRFTEAAINVNAPRPVIRHVRDFKP